MQYAGKYAEFGEICAEICSKYAVICGKICSMWIFAKYAIACSHITGIPIQYSNTVVWVTGRGY